MSKKLLRKIDQKEHQWRTKAIKRLQEYRQKLLAVQGHIRMKNYSRWGAYCAASGIAHNLDVLATEELRYEPELDRELVELGTKLCEDERTIETMLTFSVDLKRAIVDGMKNSLALV